MISNVVVNIESFLKLMIIAFHLAIREQLTEKYVTAYT